MKIVMLGYGNVAAHLVDAFEDHSETEVIQIYNRSKTASTGIRSFTTNLKDLKEADVYIIAISDDWIKDFSESLPLSGKLVVHTSGSVPMKALSEKNRRGIFYPLQTFTRGRKIDFDSIPLCIEAENEADQRRLTTLASCISSNVVKITSEERRMLHLGAVFVNNFVNHLYQVSEEIVSEHKLDFKLLQPLIMETARKIESLSPEQAQTGPAVRNDQKTIKKQLDLLQKKQHKSIYKALTKSIQKTYGKKL
jgi:predicted short-subunit dehydrogenase-like oxidoreductase (DUF2520 family)